MARPEAGVIITGYTELRRSLLKLGPEVKNATNEGLREAAKPVSGLAQRLSLKEIRRMPKSPQWAEVRVGVVSDGVYMVPKERGVSPRSPRSRGGQIRGGGLVPLMMNRSFIPALDAGSPIVEERVTRLLKLVVDSANTGRI